MAGRPGLKSGRGAPGLAQLGVRLLLGAAVVLAALFVLQRTRGLGLDARNGRNSSSGTIRIAKLASPIEILRDARGIPHVFAGRESEAWFGLGFAHAEDRLAQMVWLRRRAYGRTAELEGAGALVADRLARLLEIERASASAAPGAAARIASGARVLRGRGERAHDADPRGPGGAAVAARVPDRRRSSPGSPRIRWRS